MARILFLYSSFYGQARKVCERLGSRLAERGHAAEFVSIAEPGPDPAGYDAIVIGASIRHGKHNPAVLEFINKHRALLEAKPSAFFSVSLVARKPGKDTAETNPYSKAFLARSPWKPTLRPVRSLRDPPDHDDQQGPHGPAHRPRIHQLGQSGPVRRPHRHAAARPGSLRRT